MTQLRHCKCGLSNHFDDLYAGIGHRGSSFSDIDGVSHDGKTKRFLVQEFKQWNEPLEKAQHWMLADIATLPKWFTVWVVRRRQDGLYDFAVFAPGKELNVEINTAQQMRDRLEAWWADKPYASGDSPVVIQEEHRPVSYSKSRDTQPIVIDIRVQRAQSAAQMSNDGLARYLDFVKANIDIEDRQSWLEILEGERHRRSSVGV